MNLTKKKIETIYEAVEFVEADMIQLDGHGDFGGLTKKQIVDKVTSLIKQWQKVLREEAIYELKPHLSRKFRK